MSDPLEPNSTGNRPARHRPINILGAVLIFMGSLLALMTMVAHSGLIAVIPGFLLIFAGLGLIAFRIKT